MSWDINRETNFSKYLKKKNSIIISNFRSRVKVMADSEDPRSFGEFVPTYKHGKCWVTRITESERLAYRIFWKEKIIQLVILGEHKEVYGKDKHS